MDARSIRKEMDLLPFRNLTEEETEARRLAALRSPAIEKGRRFGGVLSGVWAFVTGIVQFLAIYPERRAVFDQLQGLSDRELADIGLERADIARVFDADFTLPGRATRATLPAAKVTTRLRVA